MISFVYFDMGGVVIKDFSGTDKWKELKSDLGIDEKKYGLLESLWDTYDTKYNFCIDYDIDKFVPIISRIYKLTLPPHYSLLADVVNRFEKNSSIWLVIEKIHKKYHIGLLTNMYPRMFKEIVKRDILPPIKWDAIIDSSVVGHQKPEQGIFEIAEKQSKSKKEEILFIDNTKINIEAAKKFGWQTFFYDSSDLLESSRKVSELFD